MIKFVNEIINEIKAKECIVISHTSANGEEFKKWLYEEKDIENPYRTGERDMCKYCERRTDIKFGWNQPELPWHGNKEISKNISGNMIHVDDTVGVIHDYKTSSPVLILKDRSSFGIEDIGVGTIYIPIKFCPECGRRLGKIK